MPLPWVPFVALFLTSLAMTLALVPFVRRLAIRLGSVDYPGGRRVNTVPVPRMGGLAVVLALAVAAGVQWLGTTYLDWPVVVLPAPGLSVNYWVLAVSVLIIFLTGFIDDLVSLRPLPKLLGQVLASSVAAASGLIVGDIVNPIAGGTVSIGWLAYPVTVIYLVAFANAINLVDGLDGLASGLTAIVSLSMFVIATNEARLDAAALAIALTGACIGFLRYNFSPAVIFLGDSGALTLGFVLGCVSLLSVTRVAGVTMLLLPIMLAGIPILDTFSAIVRRRRAHVSVGQADTGHIHHRLVREGYDPRQAVILIYLWTAVLCVGAIVMTRIDSWTDEMLERTVLKVLIFLFLLAFSLIFAIRLRLFTPVLLHHWDPRRRRDVLITPDDPRFVEEAERQNLPDAELEAERASDNGE